MKYILEKKEFDEMIRAAKAEGYTAGLDDADALVLTILTPEKNVSGLVLSREQSGFTRLLRQHRPDHLALKELELKLTRSQGDKK